MAIGLIGWGRFTKADGTRVTVPAPVTDEGKPWLVDMLREKAGEIAASFDFVQWPPVSKAQGGAGEGCDGYGVFARRDLGSLPQQGSVETRYGRLEGLLAAVAALNAEGVRSYGDLVLHQLIGENFGPGVFKYVGADGKTLDGRGGTQAGWFRGGTGNEDPVGQFCREDDVPVPGDDIPFGREVSYQNAHPAGVTLEDAKDFVSWMTRRVGFAGYRFDDVKGMYAPAVRSVMDAIPAVPFYSEYFDGNPDSLAWWSESGPMNGRSAVEDFTLHFRLQVACNGFDATELNQGNSGFWERNSGLSVGFVDNPDTDTSAGEQVMFNKGLAYAYLLSLPLRAALVYGKDYFGPEVWPGAYGLKPLIDNLCWISRMFAFGVCRQVWCDKDVYALTRDGNGGPVGWSGGLLTALNFNTLSARTITCETPFGPHRQLHDYSGHAGDIWTDAQGRATFTIPSNAYSAGNSYVCFAPAGVSTAYPMTRHWTRQIFVGDRTLDVMPLENGVRELPQRMRVRGGSSITCMLAPTGRGASRDAVVTLELLDETGLVLASSRMIGLRKAIVRAAVKKTGWLTLRLTGSGLKESGEPFELEVRYLGAS